ncbi:hypothetical protein HDV06_004524 [Boothiomyces sp. JEL0866]|nr:hypothetical protein HDV06_004524 [Boothiomyces sp. JEL0866]
MSSNETKPTEKRKRITKACDSCCKKRRKCTGEQPCDYCAANQIECLYTNPTKKRGPAPGNISRRKALESDSQSTESSNLANLKLDYSKYDSRHSFPQRIQRSTIEIKYPTEFSNWNYHSFPDIELPNGVFVPWLHAYFQLIHPSFPIFNPSWFHENYHKVPMMLLHIMYALTLVMPKQTTHYRAQADRHYHYCRALFEEGAIDNPNPFTVASMYLISMYSLNVTFSYNNVVVTLGIAVRLAQQLNFETARQIQWELPDGEILGNDEGTGKHFRGMIWFCLNESDLIVSFLRNIPFMFSINAQFPVSEMEPSPAQIYNPFAASGLYGHFLLLFQHARKIVGFMRKDIDFNNPDWKLEQNKLYVEISKWHDDLPKWITELPDDYGFDELSQSPPSWRVAYMLCFYHLFVIILYKSSLLIIVEHFQEPQSHDVFTKCLESSFMIAKIFEKFLKSNSEFYGCNTIICYIPFVAGAIFCIDTIVLGKSPKLIEKIDSCIDVMDAMAVRFPGLSVRTELLRQWKADPEVALNTFGTLTGVTPTLDSIPYHASEIQISYHFERN